VDIRSLNVYCIKGKYCNSDDGSYCAGWRLNLLSNFTRSPDIYLENRKYVIGAKIRVLRCKLGHLGV